jgi:FtsP/CotA-like multicopper oxidase with cupredoxin domain
MYLPWKASKRRVREAEQARQNRTEIVKALSQGQATRRDMFKWGLFTSAGLLLCKNGLSPYAQSAYAQVPTGTPRSPVGDAVPFTHPLNRLHPVLPTPLEKLVQPNGEWEALWPSSGRGKGQPSSKRLSYHTDFSQHSAGNTAQNPFINPVTKRGPMEGRPPGEWFGHQRWKEFFPQVGYALAFGECAQGVKFHPAWPDQGEDRLWPLYEFEGFGTKGEMPIPLLKGRYGEPMIMRAYNNLPVDRTKNGGFGRNEPSTHFHNAHNGAESDGASNAFHFPGTFYDYHWGTTLARHDMINKDATDRRASGPDGKGGLILVPGDWREIQSTMWFHDHRFFFTAENVYKGMAAMMNYYSGSDRGNESLEDGVNHRLPSGSRLDYGNVDFDVNLFISDVGTDPDAQCRFDIFTTEGFIGDLLCVNHSWQPYLDVLPRKYRLRLLNGSMARFIRLALADQNGQSVPFQFIANDGNFVVNPITGQLLDEQGPAERYDIVVDFSRFRPGETVTLVNLLKQISGNKPDGTLSYAAAMAQWQSPDPLVDPAVGPVMQFRIVDQVESVDVPGEMNYASDPDPSQVPLILTEQIPIVAPVRQRHIKAGRSGSGDSRDKRTGQCNPDCPEHATFPWTVEINGERPHSMNANRISLLIPKPGEVEHWTYENGGGGWDHPIHLHFEEAVTMNRGKDSIPVTERLARKDTWRLRPNGTVQFQVRFGEFGGAYVSHCHNTVHEDFAMLLRYQVLTDKDNPKSSNLHVDIIPTPIPTPDGCTYMTPEVLAEGNPLGNGVTVSAAPVISSTPVLTTMVGQAYSYLVTASDANGDALTYSLLMAPTGMLINATSGLITWTPTSRQVGQQEVMVQVADPKLLTATQPFTITVVPGTNVAPVITSTPITTAAELVPYRYQVIATDVNGGRLTYRLTTGPTGMTIDANSGLITWLPNSSAAGSPKTVGVRVLDEQGLYASQVYTLVVQNNLPPTVLSTPLLTAKVGVEYQYQFRVSDPQGPITYSLRLVNGVDYNPAGLSIDRNTGLVRWTPRPEQVGNRYIRLQATDATGLVRAHPNFTVVVAP